MLICKVLQILELRCLVDPQNIHVFVFIFDVIPHLLQTLWKLFRWRWSWRLEVPVWRIILCLNGQHACALVAEDWWIFALVLHDLTILKLSAVIWWEIWANNSLFSILLISLCYIGLSACWKLGENFGYCVLIFFFIGLFPLRFRHVYFSNKIYNVQPLNFWLLYSDTFK